MRTVPDTPPDRSEPTHNPPSVPRIGTTLAANRTSSRAGAVRRPAAAAVAALRR